MKKTKERRAYKRVIESIVFSCTIIMFIIAGMLFSHAFQVHAASLSVHNYVTDDTFQYSKESVIYCINGKTFDSLPGLILSNGAAVGPFDGVFKQGLNVESDYVDGKNSFSVSYGPVSIKMTLGNTEAYVNGEKRIMNNPPVVYSFGDSPIKHLYVPTRFVAETFGFDYAWDSVSSTASITCANVIYDGTHRIRYTGKTPAFVLNEVLIPSNTFPGYILDDTVLFPAEDFFQKTGMTAYTYVEGSGLLLFKNGDCMVRLVLDSPIAYIGDTAYLLPTVPRLITPENSSKAKVYVPAKFIAESLGYSVTYSDASGVFQVTGTLPNKNIVDKPNVDISDELLPDTTSYGKTLFSYETHKQILKYFNESGRSVPKSISAYTCLNSDALFLKGVAFNQINITDMADTIEILISGHHNPYNGKVSYNPEASFLNYFYISGTDSIKIIIIKTKELHYYTYSAPDGCVIHFTDVNGMYLDYLKFSEPENESENDTTDVFSGMDLTGYLPEAVFPRDYFVIRLPDGITKSDIFDNDEYSKTRFTISIPGNHMSFLSEQDAYNPVEALTKVQFSYKVSDDTTVITFNTSKIQGYSYTIADDFLAVRIADPKEIYDKIIVLDAGHGGIDPGTLRENVYEKNVNFNVVNVYAKDYFEDSDIKVYFTRTTDTKIALQTRADFAATVGADLFISFHVNAHSNAAVNGTSVYYSKSNNTIMSSGLRSSVLATSVVNHLSAAWKTTNRGILADQFIVIHNNSVPAILVECGFITNNKDFEKIKDSSYQKKAAKALFDAVSEIFERYPTNR